MKLIPCSNMKWQHPFFLRFFVLTCVTLKTLRQTYAKTQRKWAHRRQREERARESHKVNQQFSVIRPIYFDSHKMKLLTFFLLALYSSRKWQAHFIWWRWLLPFHFSSASSSSSSSPCVFFSINSNQRDFECLAPVMWKVSFGLFVCFSSTATTSSSSLAFVFVHIIGMKTKHIEFSCALYVCVFVGMM